MDIRCHPIGILACYYVAVGVAAPLTQIFDNSPTEDADALWLRRDWVEAESFSQGESSGSSVTYRRVWVDRQDDSAGGYRIDGSGDGTTEDSVNTLTPATAFTHPEPTLIISSSTTLSLEESLVRSSMIYPGPSSTMESVDAGSEYTPVVSSFPSELLTPVVSSHSDQVSSTIPSLLTPSVSSTPVLTTVFSGSGEVTGSSFQDNVQKPLSSLSSEMSSSSVQTPESSDILSSTSSFTQDVTILTPSVSAVPEISASFSESLLTSSHFTTISVETVPVSYVTSPGTISLVRPSTSLTDFSTNEFSSSVLSPVTPKDTLTSPVTSEEGSQEITPVLTSSTFHQPEATSSAASSAETVMTSSVSEVISSNIYTITTERISPTVSLDTNTVTVPSATPDPTTPSTDRTQETSSVLSTTEAISTFTTNTSDTQNNETTSFPSSSTEHFVTTVASKKNSTENSTDIESTTRDFIFPSNETSTWTTNTFSRNPSITSNPSTYPSYRTTEPTWSHAFTDNYTNQWSTESPYWSPRYTTPWSTWYSRFTEPTTPHWTEGRFTWPPSTYRTPEASFGFTTPGDGSDDSSKGSTVTVTVEMKFWIRTVLRLDSNNQTNIEKVKNILEFVYQKAFLQEAKRSRRSTGRSVDVNVVNFSMDYKDHLMSLVYTVSREGKLISAAEAVKTMEVVNSTVMSDLLGYEVVTKAEPYLKEEALRGSAETLLTWIVSGVLAGVLVFVIVCLLLYCRFCRPRISGLSIKDGEPYSQENKQRVFAGSPPLLRSSKEKSLKDSTTSPIHESISPSAPPISKEKKRRGMSSNFVTEYYVNKAFDAEEFSEDPPSQAKVHKSKKKESVQGHSSLDEISGGLFDHVDADEQVREKNLQQERKPPEPLPRTKFTDSSKHLDNSDVKDSDSSNQSGPSTPSTARVGPSPPDSVTTSLLPDEVYEDSSKCPPVPIHSKEDLVETQRQLEKMKKRISELLDDALALAGPKNTYSSFRKQRVSPTGDVERRSTSLRVKPRRPASADTTLFGSKSADALDGIPVPREKRSFTALDKEAPEQCDVVTQTPEDPPHKPRVVWSIYKTTDVAAQTGSSLCEKNKAPLPEGKNPEPAVPVVDPGKTPLGFREPTQTVIKAIKEELSKFNSTQTKPRGESFA